MSNFKTADTSEGPDPNSVRRHAKKMLTEREYALKYRRIDFYKPNPFQLKLHNAPTSARLINARSANQVGKSTGAAMQLVFDATADYPGFYQGRRFLQPPRIIRPYEFFAVIASSTSLILRDGLGRALIGDLSQEDGLGTGALPLDCIVGRPTMSRGISDYFDTVQVRRVTGGTAAISTRSYDSGRRAFQGFAADEVFLDEDDMALGDIFGEAWARLTATNGRMIMTATAIIGRTPMQKLFEEDRESHPERYLIVGDLNEAEHLSTEEKRSIELGYPDDEREARVHGGIRQGSGAVFRFNRSEIVTQTDPALLPGHVCYLWGIDLAHSSGPTAHPFAAVLICVNRDTGVVTVMDAWEMRGALPIQHVERMRGSFAYSAKVAWPKDGGIHDLNSGHTLIQSYKSRGINTLPTHSTFPDGSVSLEASVAAVQELMFSGKLKVESHLNEFVTQLGNYHRDIDGRIVPQDDDMVSAFLCGIRSLRLAKPLAETDRVASYRGYDPSNPNAFHRGRQGQQYAIGTFDDPFSWSRNDFDPHKT